MRRLLLLPLLLAVFLLGVLRDVAVNEDALRVHVVCPVHGELVHARASARKHAELAVAPDSEHHAGCEIGDLGTPPSLIGPSAPEFSAPVAWGPVAAHLAPRGPPSLRAPLINAPKTSPPLA